MYRQSIWVTMFAIAVPGTVQAESKSIVETAVEAGNFRTLVAAVTAAELAETLKGEGPFTVFAPSDEAFSKLPEGTVEALLEDLPKLRAILKYHVVPGKVMSGDVSKINSAKTANGQRLAVEADGSVIVGGARVVQADIECSNGVIHVIDRVLLPKADIVDVATEAGSFETLLTAAQAAGLVDTLRGAGPLTVLAPTDEAFAKLPKGTVETLLKDPEKLAGILTYHVIPTKALAKDVVSLKEVKTVNGKSLPIHVSTCSKSGSTSVQIGSAKVVETDVMAANGVIHVIDTVLIP